MVYKSLLSCPASERTPCSKSLELVRDLLAPLNLGEVLCGGSRQQPMAIAVQKRVDIFHAIGSFPVVRIDNLTIPKTAELLHEDEKERHLTEMRIQEKLNELQTANLKDEYVLEKIKVCRSMACPPCSRDCSVLLGDAETFWFVCMQLCHLHNGLQRLF